MDVHTIVWLFVWRSILLTTSSRRLFLAPGEEVTSLFDSVFIIGLSVSGGGEKTMLMRSGFSAHVGHLTSLCSLAKSLYPLTVSSYFDDNRDWESGRECGWLSNPILPTVGNNCKFMSSGNKVIFRVEALPIKKQKGKWKVQFTMRLRRLKLQDQCS